MKRNKFIILVLLSIPAGNLFGALGDPYSQMSKDKENKEMAEIYTYAENKIANDNAKASGFFGGLFGNKVTEKQIKLKKTELEQQRKNIIGRLQHSSRNYNDIERKSQDFFKKHPDLKGEHKKTIEELFTTAISEKRIANQNEEHRRYVEESPRVKAAAEQRRVADAAAQEQARVEAARLQAEQRRVAEEAEQRRVAAAAQEQARVEANIRKYKTMSEQQKQSYIKTLTKEKKEEFLTAFDRAKRG